MPPIPRHKYRAVMLAGLSLWALAHLCAASARQGVATPPPDDIAMIIASSTGNLQAVKNLLGKGMSIDHQDFTGNTPLIYAARYARLDLVKYLLRCGADVNAQSHWGTTALKESVRKGSLAVVQELLEAGADVDQADNRHESALFDAVRYRRLWAVDMLLDRNAHVDIKNDKGYTPIFYAVEQHQVRIVAMLKQRIAGERLSAGDDKTLVGDVMAVRHVAATGGEQNPSLGDQFVPAVSLSR
jgi:ankyrin repeat protein